MKTNDTDERCHQWIARAPAPRGGRRPLPTIVFAADRDGAAREAVREWDNFGFVGIELERVLVELDEP